MRITEQISADLAEYYAPERVGFPVAIYLIGSLATGEFNQKTSDLDYIIVVEAMPAPQERLEMLRRLRLLTNDFCNVFARYVAPENSVSAQSEVFFADEFIGYLHAFTVRVWSPLSLGAWKLVRGADMLPVYGPNEQIIRHDLLVTYQNFARTFQQRINDPVGASKYLRRAVTKFVWMIEGQRPERHAALARCAEHVPHPSLPFLMAETQRIADQGFRYPKDARFLRFGVEATSLLIDLRRRLLAMSTYDDLLLRHIDIQQQLYLRIREGRFNYFGVTDPAYARQIPVKQQVLQHMHAGFIDDLQLLGELERCGGAITADARAYVDDHLRRLAQLPEPPLDYYEHEFFPCREQAFTALRSVNDYATALVRIESSIH